MQVHSSRRPWDGDHTDQDWTTDGTRLGALSGRSSSGSASGDACSRSSEAGAREEGRAGRTDAIGSGGASASTTAPSTLLQPGAGPQPDSYWFTDGSGGSYEGDEPGLEDFVTTGGRWTDNSGTSSGSFTTTLGASGGVVAWSIAGAGLTNDTGQNFFTGTTVDMATFLPFDYVAVLRQAFDAWAAVANIEFIQVEDSGGNIGVGTYPTIRVVGGFIDGQTGPNVLARAFFPSSGAAGGDMVFDNGNTTFYTNPTNFFLTALHEIGHALGLNHEATPPAGNLAIMNPTINTSLTGLQTDDINGLVSVYGAQDFGTNAYYLPASRTTLTVLDDAPNMVIFANALDNTITDASGASTIYGLAGIDTLNGGLGIDVLVGGVGGDTLNGGGDFDYASYASAVTGVAAFLTVPGSNTGEAAGDSYNSIEGLIGSAHGDTLMADDNVNTLFGGGSNDVLFGLGGADTLYGEEGDDSLFGGLGGDALVGGNGFDYARYDFASAGVAVFMFDMTSNTGEAVGDTYSSVEGIIGTNFGDTLFGDSNFNILSGLNGNDVLFGADGADALYGGNNDDSLFGQGGGDGLIGGLGDDYARYDFAPTLVTVNLANPVLNTGEAGGDVYIEVEHVTGSAFGDSITGDANSNVLSGLGGADTLRGGGSGDALFGGDGADHIYGEAGFDGLFGGADADQFRFARLEGQDQIGDFSSSVDKIGLQAASFGGGLVAGGSLAGRFAVDAPNAAVGQFVYVTATRTLGWDPDGTGGAAIENVAVLQVGATLTINDLLLF